MNRTHTTTQSLHDKGYRLTPQRLMILEAVEHEDGHISAEEIHAHVCARYPHMNISTVYRTLDLLQELGLVTRTDLGDGRIRYHNIKDGQHHHLVCQSCSSIINIHDSILNSLWTEIMQQYKFRVNMKHMAFFGLCPNCQP